MPLGYLVGLCQETGQLSINDYGGVTCEVAWVCV